MSEKEKDYYTGTEVAKMFGVKKLTVYRWIYAGLLPAEKKGQWHITKDGIETLIKNQRIKGIYYTRK